MESLSWRQSTYSQTSSEDSLYLPMDNHALSRRRPLSGYNPNQDLPRALLNNNQTIKRWNGITREAINWNSLPRDPELFLPTGNCLVYLYPAGHSQRGPSFRIPYHILLSSECQPLVQQCLVSMLNISSPEHVVSKPLSYGSVKYSVSQDTRSYLYLYPPIGLSRAEGYSYHITTRNFFAWLLGVPLVGTDPVSALLDLKARMDIWRNPGANNFKAVFEYARQQAYGDFEEIQIEMGKRRETERKSETNVTNPSEDVQTHDCQRRHNTSRVRRSDSLKRGLRGSMPRPSKPHIALQDKRLKMVPPHNYQRQQLSRLATFPITPAVPSTGEIGGAVRQLRGPSRAPPSRTVSTIQAGETVKMYRHTVSSTSGSLISPITPSDSSGIDAAIQCLTRPPSTDSVYSASNTQSKANKKKRRVSWADNTPTVAEARMSQTDITYPNMRGIGLQSAQASSSAINLGKSKQLARRSLPSLPSSAHQVTGGSMKASMPASTTIPPWGEGIRLARPMSTASLVSIPNMHRASTPAKLEPCTCCGKMLKPDSSRSPNSQPPRPASVRSMKSFRSTKSRSSLRSIRSSLSLRSIRSSLSLRSIRSSLPLHSIRSSLPLHSIRSSMSLSSIRSSLSRSSAKKSFADIQASMKDRRASFRARLNRMNRKPDPIVDKDIDIATEHTFQERYNPTDYVPPSPKRGYVHFSVKALNSTPVELEAEPLPLKTLPELASGDTTPRFPDSYSDGTDAPYTPPEGQPITMTTIRPKEIYTSRIYRHQPKPQTANISTALRPDNGSNPEDLDQVLNIGTPGGFEVDFVDTLIAQLHQVEIGGESD
jgi:hypothetical protein